MADTVSWAMDRVVGALGGPDRDRQNCECSKGMTKFPFAAPHAFEVEHNKDIKLLPAGGMGKSYRPCLLGPARVLRGLWILLQNFTQDSRK